MKCDNCGKEIDRIYICTCDDNRFCQEECMHDSYTDTEIDWLFDKELAWWQEFEGFNDDTHDS